jgi:hypothetical protein
MEEIMASVLEQTQVVPGKDFKNEAAKRLAEEKRTRLARQKQSLNLQRESILSQRTSQPARRVALEAALAQIDGQIAKLN